MTIMSRKIPGLLPPMPKTEIDGKVEKLELKPKIELLELLQRQEKLLSNRGFIDKLADKGERIKLFKEKLQKQLSLRDEVEKSSNLLSNLLSHMNIESKPEISRTEIENIEWERNREKRDTLECLDSDDDSNPEDPLAIIAQSTDLKKKIKVLKKEESLIKPADLEEINSFYSMNDELSSSDAMHVHVQYVYDKTVNKVNPNQRVSFKPYKTTVSNVHEPGKEILRKRGKFWEVTAATPPPAIHGPIQEISLQESLRLQDVQNQHLKGVQTRHAAERLAAQLGKSVGDIPLSAIPSGKYREVEEIQSDDSDSSDNETSDKEVHDEEPSDGGVVFTVMK